MKQFFTILSMVALPSPFMASGQVSPSSGEIAPVITEVPDGAIPSVYTLEATSWSGMNLEVAPTSVSGYKTVLYTSENKVYWQNPIYGAQMGSYIVGEKKNDKIVFSFPQTLKIETFAGETGVLYYYIYTYNADYNCFIDCENPEVEVTIKEDGTLVMPSEITIGAANPGEGGGYAWAGAGIGNVELTPFNTTAVTAPDDVVFEDWVMENSFSTAAKYVKIGFSGNDVYFKDFSKTCPDFTFKGTLEGNKITCPSNQYMGEYADHFFIRFMTVNWSPAADRTERVDPDLVLSQKDFVFLINNDRNALRTEDPENFFIFSASDRVSYPILVVENPYIYTQGEINPKSPQAPYNLGMITSDWVYSKTDFLTFSLYDYNIANQYFPRANLYYEVMVDGEPFAFTRRNGYPNLKESISQIPVELSNSYFSGGLNQEVSLKTRDYSTLGIRILYTEEDGTTYYSPISYFPNLDPSGITESEINAEEVSVEYFDLTGNRVDGETAGIVIRKAVMSNGKVKISKQINK